MLRNSCAKLHPFSGAVFRGVRAVAVVLLLQGAYAAMAEPVRTGGTGAALGSMRLLADAYRKVDSAFSLEIVPNLGSGGGLKALERDAIQFAVISRLLSKEEAAKGFTLIEYGRTPFVLATTRKDVAGLTLEQIADIYTGKQTSWPDGTPIRLVLRPANDVDTAHLGAFSARIKDAVAAAMSRPGMVVGITDHDSATHIARLAGGLGSSSLALILSEKHPIYALAIEGVTPTGKAIADGTYPHFKTLNIVTRGNPPATVTRFIAFVRSAEGRRILADNGHWVAHALQAAAPAR